MLHMLATLAEYERELIVERVNAGITAARESGTRFGRPPVNPDIIAEKLAIVADARSRGRTAAKAAALVGWSRATLYRHQAGAENPTAPREDSNNLAMSNGRRSSDVRRKKTGPACITSEAPPSESPIVAAACPLTGGNDGAPPHDRSLAPAHAVALQTLRASRLEHSRGSAWPSLGHPEVLQHD
jgi:hypothetical protein